MLQHVATRTVTAAQSSFTFNDVPLGAAAADRYIIVSVSAARGNSTLEITNITVAGAETIEVVAANNVRACSVIRRTTAPLVGGTTGQIVVTLSNTANGMHLDVWSITELASAEAHDTATGITTSANTVAASLDIPPRGVVIASGFGFRSGNNDWRGSAASDEFPNGAVAASIGATHDVSGFSWTGLIEDSDSSFTTSLIAINWMLLAAASFQFKGGERVFGAVMG